ncbi:flagellar hook protein FlgE [Limimonas halophila]|uniref:Flagellar hook protein FlgE n=1 Tax=Limimonas halophila TaxID=1082479 RepID=A0A1G7M554_9PROT|nr:flagellar hook-basal body complex protein [Limimonas halophila]SDF56841.1 flagellar hook protein FlgE [Limimonas halophila]
MSIFGALNASVSGIQAQSDALGVISDNISNSNTVGFKERQATFESLVVNSGASAGFSPGGVLGDAVSNVGEQGQLRATNNNTDLAIQGDGFFAVKNETAINQDQDTPLKFTRNGQFRVNNEGLLTNTSGHVLQGWQIGPDGTLPADQQNPASLTSVEVDGLSGQARPTSQISAGATLPAQRDPQTAVQTGAGNGNPGDTLNTQFAEQIGGTGINGNSSFDLTIGDGGTNTITLTGIDPTAASLDDIENAVNNLDVSGISSIGGISDSGGDAFSANIQNGKLSIDSEDGTVEITDTGGNGTFGDADPAFVEAAGLVTDTSSPQTGDAQLAQEEFTTQIFDSQGNAHNLNVEFSKTSNANEWQVQLEAPRLSNDAQGAPSGLFSDSAGNTTSVATGTVQFNPDGSLDSFDGFGGFPGVDNPSNDGNLSLNIDFNSGRNATNANGQEITLNLGTPKGGGPNNNAQGRDGLQQADTAFTVDDIQQDGTRFGNFTGVSVDDEGIVTAQFDNGEQQDIFKLPVAQFNSQTELGRESGNIFAQTQASGEPILTEAGVGGAGDIQSSALERSTVDLSEQFSDMIETQQSYTANTRVLTTSDEMLQTLNQAVR